MENDKNNALPVQSKDLSLFYSSMKQKKERTKWLQPTGLGPSVVLLIQEGDRKLNMKESRWKDNQTKTNESPAYNKTPTSRKIKSVKNNCMWRTYPQKKESPMLQLWSWANLRQKKSHTFRWGEEKERKDAPWKIDKLASHTDEEKLITTRCDLLNVSFKLLLYIAPYFVIHWSFSYIFKNLCTSFHSHHSTLQWHQ